MQYQSAIFFDNDAKYIQNVQQYCDISAVHVGETRGFTTRMISPLPKIYRDDFGTIGEAKNPYYDLVGGQGDLYDVQAGFKEEHERLLDQWIETTKGKKRIAMFDWDRTITKIEGYSYPDGDYTIKQFGELYEKPTLTATHINQYLCGGIGRYEFIKGVMKKCKENDVDILIISNNGMCQSSPSFKEMVADICADAPHAIVCSSKVPWLGHKGKALKQTYPSLCTKAVLGGKRKTRSRLQTQRKQGKSKTRLRKRT
jgi:hypothetical protein